MPRRRLIEPRRSIFITVEGPSDRAFIRFLGMCSEEKELHLHPDVHSADGGDTLTVVQHAISLLSKSRARSSYILLDEDRIEDDIRAGRDAQDVASKNNLEVIILSPNLEGVLLRLHPGHEQRNVPRDAMKELRKVWPEYEKSLPAQQFAQRFELDDLLRAARHDKQLQKLLDIFGLNDRHT